MPKDKVMRKRDEDFYPVTLVLGKKAGQKVLRRASFLPKASDFVVAFLKKHGATSGEDLTDACKAAGILPDPGKDDRQFGSVYASLSRRKMITQVAYIDIPRRRGHGTSGGRLWRAAHSHIG